MKVLHYGTEPQGVLYSGTYRDIDYFVANSSGWNPCAYIRLQLIDPDPSRVKASDFDFIRCHGGVTFVGTINGIYWGDECFYPKPGFYVGWDYTHAGDYDVVLGEGVRYTTSKICYDCKVAIDSFWDYYMRIKGRNGGNEDMNIYDEYVAKLDADSVRDDCYRPVMFVGGRGGGKTLSMAQMMAANYIRSNSSIIPRIEKIIVNGNHTIVIWEDGTKTIVKPSENDNYDLEAAVCAAIAKKMYGSNSALKKEIKKKTVYQKSKKSKKEDASDAK